jgi:hypothetical protein
MLRLTAPPDVGAGKGEWRDMEWRGKAGWLI